MLRTKFQRDGVHCLKKNVVFDNIFNIRILLNQNHFFSVKVIINYFIENSSFSVVSSIRYLLLFVFIKKLLNLYFRKFLSASSVLVAILSTTIRAGSSFLRYSIQFSAKCLVEEQIRCRTLNQFCSKDHSQIHVLKDCALKLFAKYPSSAH